LDYTASSSKITLDVGFVNFRFPQKTERFFSCRW